jgi:hypothetical protein
VRCPPLNDSTKNTTTTRTMMKSFHHTIAVLTRANHRTPYRLITQKTSSIAAATA